MPVVTRSQRRRRAETTARSCQTRRSRLSASAPDRISQTEQTARYRGKRQTTEVSNAERPERGTSESTPPTQLPEFPDVEAMLRSRETEDSGGMVEEPWIPSLVIGSSFGDDLSAIQLADRTVDQWRAIVEYHQENLPGAVAPLQEMLDKAIAERDQIEDTAENRTPRSALQSTALDAINDRLKLLHLTLSDSTFEPEIANIRAAIHGYINGTIPYSTNFTLIYAGRIVDTCPSYESFSVGPERMVRLDRYAAAHGPGWLWYEPPLNSPSAGCETAKLSYALNNPPSRRAGNAGNSGFWQITMGFRRRAAWVSRPAAFPNPPPPKQRRCRLLPDGTAEDLSEAAVGSPADGNNNNNNNNNNSGDDDGSDGEYRLPKTIQDPSAPTLYFNMHLDSGASKPTLYADDFKSLGIDVKRYAGQTTTWASTIFGKAHLKMFEIDVGIYRPNTGHGRGSATSLVPASPPDRVWPGEPDAVGSTLPVMMLPGSAPSTSALASHSNRLSGMLPFYAAYLSSAPGTYTLWLGEDRRDVLGASRMPGQMRYHGFRHAEEQSPAGAGHPGWLERDLGAPDRIVFEHKLAGADGGGHSASETWVTDEDLGTGASVITLGSKSIRWAGEDGQEKAEGESEGQGPGVLKKRTWRIEPRAQAGQIEKLKSALKKPIRESQTETGKRNRTAS